MLTSVARNMVKVPSKKRALRKFRKSPDGLPDPTSADGVLHADIADLLADRGLEPYLNDMEAFWKRDKTQPWPDHREVTVEIESVSSNGLGLALLAGGPKVVVVPTTVPGDRVVAKIWRTLPRYFDSDLVRVVEPSPLRSAVPQCKYFGACSGCQYQMASYEWQLKQKRDVVVRAYRRLAPKLFSGGNMPDIHPTVPSPNQYGYRTKLSPHFDTPRDADFPIGFGQRGRKQVLDIEECPIATPVVNRGLSLVRERVKARPIQEWKRGATLLIREAENEEIITDNKVVMREKVGSYTFEYLANEFFQNNNSILPVVTDFVARHIQIDGKAPRYLVDTYCGCGLFAVTCGQAAERVIGVEISQLSVAFARKNAELNGVRNAEFIVGMAERIFAHVSDAPDQTAVVIDPPRKGCDQLFLDQLLSFGPAKIVYVSCNVNSQARDIEYFCSKAPQYRIESLGGFDFFPQTYHVEGVAVLSR